MPAGKNGVRFFSSFGAQQPDKRVVYNSVHYWKFLGWSLPPEVHWPNTLELLYDQIDNIYKKENLRRFCILEKKINW